VKFDPDIPAERQAQDIVKKLPEVLPIKKCEIQGTLKAPTSAAGAVTGIIQKWAKIKKEVYLADGCSWDVSLVPGDYDVMMNELQKATKGDFQFDLADHDQAATIEEEAPSTPGKAKKGSGTKTKRS